MTRLEKTRGLVRLILFGIAVLAMKGFAHGQTEKEDLAIVQSLFTKSKKSIISAYLDVDNSERNVSFWKLYNEYEFKRKAMVTERIQLLRKYLANYYVMDDVTAKSLTTKMMKSEKQVSILDKKYFKRFEKRVGGIQATKLFQIERYIQTAIQNTVQEQTPILGEMEKLGMSATNMFEF